jgi:DNA-binding MarR family transcriptional regulator
VNKTVRSTLKREVCPEEVVYLELLRTTDMLSRGVAQLLKSHDLSATQYNVLRILRGAPAGLVCGEIAERMITRDPDVTRLLDRLQKRKLIERHRDSQDRRAIMVKITRSGLHLLAGLDEPIRQMHRSQLGHLGVKHLHNLSRLLLEARKLGS